MQKVNYVFFSCLKMLKNLLCIYNALYLSKLETYKLYRSNKLKQIGRLKQQTTNKGRLGTLAWVLTMTKNHRILTKASDNQPLSEYRLEKIEPKTLITDLDQDTLTHNPNRPKYFRTQTVNNPRKKDSRDFEKHLV